MSELNLKPLYKEKIEIIDGVKKEEIKKEQDRQLQELMEMKSNSELEQQKLNEQIKLKLEKKMRLIFLMEFLEDYEAIVGNDYIDEDSLTKMTKQHFFKSRFEYYDRKFQKALIDHYLQDYIKNDELLLFLIYWCINNKKIVILRSICLLVDPIKLCQLLLEKNKIIYLIYPNYSKIKFRTQSPFLFAISIQRLRIVKLFSSFIKLTNIAFSQRFPVKFPDDLTENASVESVEYDDYDNRKKDVSSIRYELLLDPEEETSVYKQYSQKKDDSHKHHFFGGRKTSKRRTKKI